MLLGDKCAGQTEGTMTMSRARTGRLCSSGTKTRPAEMKRICVALTLIILLHGPLYPVHATIGFATGEFPADALAPYKLVAVKFENEDGAKLSIPENEVTK